MATVPPVRADDEEHPYRSSKGTMRCAVIEMPSSQRIRSHHFGTAVGHTSRNRRGVANLCRQKNKDTVRILDPHTGNFPRRR